MKKQALFVACAFLFALTSCKKSESSNSQKDELDALAKTYDLKPVSAVPSTVTPMQFETVKDLEIYLKSQESSGNNIAMRGPDTPEGDHESNDGIVFSSYDGNPLGVGGIITYTSTIISNYYKEDQLPDVYQVGWTYDQSTNQFGNITQTLSYSGPNFGSWTYYQTTGSGSGNSTSATIQTIGLYTEYYGIGGLFTYNKVREMALTLNYNTSASTSNIKYTFKP